MIAITKDDLLAGNQGEPDECPLALALNRALPGREIVVFSTHATMNGNGTSFPFSRIRYDLSDAAREFVAWFDRASRHEIQERAPCEIEPFTGTA